MSGLNYIKGEKISLKKHFNERWLQDRIEEDTSILGLGELDIHTRERKQSSGGRIDFLFYNSDINTMYETEIQLGATDESHIIRTIEYWDIERRRYQTKEHRAVIVAEEITNRFFNVIGLMSKSIPIIAIQVSAIKVNDEVLLHFTKVLDLYEEPEDEVSLGGEEVNRQYWEKLAHPKSITLMDDIINIVKNSYPNIRISYNKYHVAIGTSLRNFIWLRPRKTANNCHLELKVDIEDVEDIKLKFDEMGISYNLRKEDIFAVSMQSDRYKKNEEKIAQIIRQSTAAFS
jgi:hypothetical protein